MIHSTMKKIFGLLVITVWCTCCNAQLCRVQKAQAFFTVSFPGTQFADEQGNKINPEPIVERYIYLECKCKVKPAIDAVLYNGILFTASVADKEEQSNNIGIKKNNGKPILLNAKKEDHVWRIDLTQAGGKTLQHDLVKKIIIKGKLDKIKFTYSINTETELSTPDRY
jgi:hypothetical protein